MPQAASVPSVQSTNALVVPVLSAFTAFPCRAEPAAVFTSTGTKE